MITISDTTKRDWVLAIIGGLALFLFFLFYGDFHPFGAADSSLGEVSAIERSTQQFQSLGYRSDREPDTQFKVNSSLLDSLQRQESLHELYRDDQIRSMHPAYYWESSFFIESRATGGFGFGQNQATTIQIQLNEAGELIGFINPREVLPSVYIDYGAINSTFPSRTIQFSEQDSTIFERLSFSLSDSYTIDSLPEEINFSETLTLGRDAAETIAQYHLSNSGWDKDQFSISKTEINAFDEHSAAKVTFLAIDRLGNLEIRVDISVLPTGSLVSMEYSFWDGERVSANYRQVVSNIRNAVIIFILFWIVILLFIRVKMRLIDMKAAVLIAVLAGFIYPFVTAMQILASHLNSFGAINLPFVLTLFLICGVIAAFTSIIYFIVTSIADSISRENWAEKLRTSDLIRTGHFLNRPVGLVFIRGIIYAFILTGIWTLLFFLVPGSSISLETSLFGSTHYLPNVVSVLSNFVWYFIITQIVFLVVVGFLRNITKSSVVSVMMVGVIFAAMNPLGYSFSSLSVEMVFMGIIGLSAGYIYLKEDFLTVLVSLFIFSGLIDSASGWLLDSSPDKSIFITNVVIIIGGLLYGSYSLYKGKSIRELPKYVPEYIEELAQEERIKQELQIARKVQESFLPVKAPDFRGLDIAAICKPAYETGGDYYDFIEIDDNKLAVAIGDVSGKGIQAAFFMTFTKGVLHAICQQFESTTDALAKTNNLFRKNAKRGTFISLIFGVIDLEKSRFKFSRAGHNPLLYFNSAEEKLNIYTPEGMGIGMADEELFRNNISEQEIELQRDDILVLFTDGVVEATNRMEEFYGDERLHKMVKKYNRLGARDMLSKIIEDVNTFGENSIQHDDLTILIIKKR